MDLTDAKQLLTNGDPMSAFQTMRGVLEYPGQLEHLDDWEQCFQLFADISEELGVPEFAETIRKVATNPDDCENLYNFGYEAYEQGLFGPAATALTRANHLKPGTPKILSELASCLENLGCNQDASEVLQRSGIAEHHPLLRYLLAFNSLMCGNFEEPEKLLPGISDGSDPSFVFMAEQLEIMLERCKATQPQDLRDWHLGINGGLLLHLSPYGFDEGMSGRYAFIQDSHSMCLEGLQLLELALKKLGQEVPRVYMLGDRSSQILAQAAALYFKCPLENWPGEQPGLIVSYDPSLIQDEETFESLQVHRPGQVFWAHACDWVEPFPFTPDITTFLYQSNTAPWDEQLGGPDETISPDDSPPKEIAQKILQADGEITTHGQRDSLDATLSKALRLQGKLAAGAVRNEGRRQRFRPDSPIKSSRFF